MAGWRRSRLPREAKGSEMSGSRGSGGSPEYNELLRSIRASESYFDTVEIRQPYRWGRLLPFMYEHCGPIVPRDNIPTYRGRTERALKLNQPDRRAIEYLPEWACR